ncbi:MAG: ATPase domain-containing protein, partial [Candidatus Nanohaloarchaea archaeon]
MERPEKLSTGCDALDDLLGGGIEHGVITNVYGGAGSGKTNVCVQALVAAVRDGGSAVFIDTEGGFSAERFMQMHDDDRALDRVRLYEPTTFDEQEAAFRTLQEAVADVDADLVAVDCLVS